MKKNTVSNNILFILGVFVIDMAKRKRGKNKAIIIPVERDPKQSVWAEQGFWW